MLKFKDEAGKIVGVLEDDATEPDFTLRDKLEKKEPEKEPEEVEESEDETV